MVYTAIRSLVMNVSSSNIPAGPLPCFTGADRFSGISREEAAEGATRNVTDSQYDVDIPSLADELIRSKGRTSAKALKILKRFCKDSLPKFEIIPYRPPAFIDPENLNHESHVNEMLSTLSSAITLEPIIEEVMKGHLCQHSEDLDWLREHYFNAHYSLVLGRTKKMVAYVIAHPIPTKDISKVSRVISDHLKFFAIRTAQDLAAMVGSMYTKPYHHCFSGFNPWKSTSHVVLSTLAAPATVLQRLIKGIPKSPTEN